MRVWRVISGLELAAGEQMPRGYGIAYREYTRDTYVCYRVPLNWIVAACREFWGIMRRGPYWWDTTAKRLYERGFEAGTENGRQQSQWDRNDVERDARRVGWAEGWKAAADEFNTRLERAIEQLPELARRDLN